MAKANKRAKGERARTSKQIAAEKRITLAALALALIIIASSLIFSRLTLDGLAKKILPLADEAVIAASNGDTELAAELASRIGDALRERETALQLIVNHRDITELLRFADEATAVGNAGAADVHIAAMNGIRTLFTMLKKGDRFSIGNIL